MSLTAAVLSRFDNDTDDDIVALRTTLGAQKLCVDRAPTGTALPYATVSHTVTVLVSERKTQDKRVEDCTLIFDAWAPSRITVETILDQIDEAYVGHSLTLTNRSWMATYFSNRFVEEEKLNLWRGRLELTARQQK